MKKTNEIVLKESNELNNLNDIYGQWKSETQGLQSTCIFNDFSWVSAWIDTYWQKTWQLKVYTLYYNDKIIAIAPFYIQPSKYFYQLNKLFFLGQGEPEISEVASEYNDILIVQGFEELVINELASKLCTLKVDQIYFRAILNNSYIDKLLKKSFNYHSIQSHTRYITSIKQWSIKKLSKNTRARYRRSLNQLTKINASFYWIEPQQYEKFINTLTKYHQTRWQNKGKKGAFSHQKFLDFHQLFSEKNRQESIKISAIIVDEKPIAINYYLNDKTCLYFYQSGWDEKEFSTLSPGLALHLWSIEHCNFEYYDFMMGSMNDTYKSKFLSTPASMHNINIQLTPWKLILKKVLYRLKLK
jgi:hypothetical protein